MKPFRFSDETLLYAKHADVVEEMYKRFEANLRAFFDEVAAHLREREWPCELRYVVSSGSAYYWLSAEPETNAERDAVVWCSWNDAGIVRDHGVSMSVTWAKGSSEQRSRIAALADHPMLAGISTKKKRKPSIGRVFSPLAPVLETSRWAPLCSGKPGSARGAADTALPPWLHSCR